MPKGIYTMIMVSSTTMIQTYKLNLRCILKVLHNLYNTCTWNKVKLNTVTHQGHMVKFVRSAGPVKSAALRFWWPIPAMHLPEKGCALVAMHWLTMHEKGHHQLASVNPSFGCSKRYIDNGTDV